MRPIRLGVLVSGEGTNLQALMDAIARKELDAEIACVLSNKPGVAALERSRKGGIFAAVMPMNGFPSRAGYDKALAEELRSHCVDLVILAGFMRIVGKAFLDYFPDRVLNVHPALLPDRPGEDRVLLPDGTISKVFRGLNAVEQTLQAGVKWSGATIHLVTPDVDRGPVLEREAVPVFSSDTAETLHARIKEVEHRLLPRAVAQYAKKLA